MPTNLPLRRNLPALDPVTYARGHALFEARSDQRSLIITWLQAQLDLRAASRSLLSVGCGDGSVDAPLAAACADRPRTWTGVDPHRPSAEAFEDRLRALESPGLTVRSHVSTFADLTCTESYDVVMFVHSLYYVEDLDATLTGAIGRLSPGGALLVLHAPLGALNQLTEELAPPVSGHPRPWAPQVEEALDRLPVAVRRTELAATVDLSDCADADPALLDFTVQALLDPAGRIEVIDRLRQISHPGPGIQVPHPVTAYAVTPLAGG